MAQPVRSEIVGESSMVIDALSTLQRVADCNVGILLTGETGTGKELFARAVHRASSRRNRPFVAVNCAAIPESLLETELFGHIKGAYTGATNARPGRFMSANEGTIFLDEIGDMTLAAQAKLLRVLEGRSSIRSAPTRTFRSTSASWRRRTGTSRRWSPRGSFAPTSTSGSR
ncbi:MAG: sigma-54 factor interaction domain-containing protein [Kofleriaceae bacterium]